MNSTSTYNHSNCKMSQEQHINEHFNMKNSSENLTEKSLIINIPDHISLISRDNEKTISTDHPDVIPQESRVHGNEDTMKHLQKSQDQRLILSISPTELTAHINLGLNLNDEIDKAILLENDINSQEDNTHESLNNSLSDISSIILRKTTLQFMIYALGICCFFILSGLFSEKLLRGSFGPHEERFSFVCVFVFIQNVVNHIYAEVLLCTLFNKDEDKTDKKLYALASLTNCISMYLANKSLAWINYPTQVLAKSMRPIPVMIFNVIIGKQRYSLKKYCFVTLVVIGVSMFVLTNNSPTSDMRFKLGWGELFVSISLIFDGVTGAFQERMRLDYETQPGHFMSNLNKWSMLYVGIGMFVSQEVQDFCRFIVAYPIARYYLTAIAICSALGQTFIFLMISHFGSLSCSLVTTTRKFFTILGSIIIFRHSMSTLQLVATFLVFLGLFLDTYFSNKEHHRSKKSGRN